MFVLHACIAKLERLPMMTVPEGGRNETRTSIKYSYPNEARV